MGGNIDMTPENRIRQLILRGVMPSEAEQIVQTVEERQGRLLSPTENGLAALQDETTAAVDLLWVFYTPDIPDKYRRLWTARKAQDG